jgi:hypothetical protein
MSLTKEGLRRLSTRELWAIVKLSEFQNQQEEIKTALISKDGLEPIPFQELHSQEECQVGYKYLGSRPSGFIDVDFMVDQSLKRIQYQCKTHNVQSDWFEDFTFPTNLERFE